MPTTPAENPFAKAVVSSPSKRPRNLYETLATTASPQSKKQQGLQRQSSFAVDGEKALKFMMDSPAHLVISDVNMPLLDGMGLLKAIRGYKPTQRVPFIMLTGQADRAVIDAAAKLGVNNYLVKPVTVAKLRVAIEAIFGKIL